MKITQTVTFWVFIIWIVIAPLTIIFFTFLYKYVLLAAFISLAGGIINDWHEYRQVEKLKKLLNSLPKYSLQMFPADPKSKPR